MIERQIIEGNNTFVWDGIDGLEINPTNIPQAISSITGQGTARRPWFYWVDMPGTPTKLSGYSQAALKIWGGHAGFPDNMSGNSQAALQVLDRLGNTNCVCSKAVKKKKFCLNPLPTQNTEAEIPGA